jgi:hypothetical protein
MHIWRVTGIYFDFDFLEVIPIEARNGVLLVLDRVGKHQLAGVCFRKLRPG